MTTTGKYTVRIVEGVRFCLNELGQSTCPYDCGGEHDSGKLTDVEILRGGQEFDRHVSTSESAARRWAQRRAKALGVRVEVGS